MGEAYTAGPSQAASAREMRYVFLCSAQTFVRSCQIAVWTGRRRRTFLLKETHLTGNAAGFGTRGAKSFVITHYSNLSLAQLLAYSCHQRSSCQGYLSEEASTDLCYSISTEELHREWLNFARADVRGSTSDAPLRGTAQDEEEQQCPTLPEPQVPRVHEMPQEKGALHDRATRLR